MTQHTIPLVQNRSIRYDSQVEMYTHNTKYLKSLFCSFPRVNDEDVRLMLWDTAGQEEFDAITKAYYRGKTPHSQGRT